MIALKEFAEVKFTDKYCLSYEVDYREYDQYKGDIEDQVYSQIGRDVFRKLKENKNFVARLKGDNWGNSPNGPHKEFRATVEIYELTTNNIF